MRQMNWWLCAVLVVLAVPVDGVRAGEEAAGNPIQAAAEPKFDDASLEFFEKEVRPILTARCVECHGGEKGDPKGGLRMDSRAALLKGGDTEPAIVPGKPKESLMISAINYGDLYQMPPKSKLPAKEIATLTKWVELGAPWSKEAKSSAGQVKPFDLAARKAEHWCWQPITDHAPPTVKDEAWPLSSTDRFILAKLEAKGLKPASPAEKHTLLRRVYFDVIGLPPTPEEVAAFVNDTSPQAMEHVVDRLLDSVHFGERWARHWLDLVRYAETRGHEFEPIIPNAWQYRDYVIRALNADVTYDRFLTEHIAGDLIEPRWRDARQGTRDKGQETEQPADTQLSALSPQPSINESILGTGFWFLGEEVHSPVDVRKDETDRMDNRLDVMTKTFLGLTVGCARCHDHKFDAISQRDYYAMTGYLISSSYRQIRVQTQERDREIASILATLRTNARREIANTIVEAAKPTLDKLDQYLLVARQLVEAGVTLEESGGERSRAETVLADFERDSWGDWKTEGTAFGNKPPRKGDDVYEAPLEGFRGERLVNSHRNAIEGDNNAGTRDAQVGRLISPTFRIERRFIRFLIGGGAHPGRTCINLIVGGKTVRTATGQNSGTLQSHEWKVADLMGKDARIEIVDAERGGWGHILVDQIVFADGTASSAEPAVKSKRLARASQETVNELAAKNGLDAKRLSRWCVELAMAKSDKRHPLHDFVVQTPQAKRSIPTDQELAASPKYERLVVDFGEPRAGDMIQDGVSFGTRPVGVGQIELVGSPDKPDLRVATIGGWERDLFWKEIKLAGGSDDDYGTLGGWHRHGRSVRSPEFTLNSSKLWYLVRGSVRAYATVNSHLIVGGPLHGALLREFKHVDDQWHWAAHDLELYRGHRLHVEFSPADDGICEVAVVVQGDNAPAIPNLGINVLVFYSAESTEIRAKQIRDCVTNTLTQFAGRHRLLHSGSDFAASDAVLVNWFLDRRDLLLSAPGLLDVEAKLASLREQESQLAKGVQWESQLAPAILDGNGVNEQLLIRGNSNAPKDPVPRRFLEALEESERPEPAKVSAVSDQRAAGGGQRATASTQYSVPSTQYSALSTREASFTARSPVEASAGSGRLALSQQMIESPFAARVAVNRVWNHLFGRGIVPTVDNFGVLGQLPTHPELLDHLATQFVKDGWSQKRLIKSLILSRAYQMSSKPTDADAIDPGNLLWHRMPIKRLEGEVIRDSLLAVSGRLDRTAFGPSVPIHLTPFMEGRGRPGVNGPVDGNGRRSIYIAVRRNFLSPMMLAFDTPSPFSTVGRRTSSNVPAQALILMNDPLVIEQAKRWAEQLLADPSQTPEQRIDAMYQTAFARNATNAEKSEALGFLDAQSTRFGLPDSLRRTSPQAWADLCHVLFNVKEFVFIE